MNQTADDEEAAPAAEAADAEAADAEAGEGAPGEEAAAEVADAEAPAPEAAAEAEPAAASRRTVLWRRYALPGVALVVFVAGTFLWWRAATDDQVALASVRDEVLIVATSHIETMNTLDYRDVEGGLEAWRTVTTGTLHDQLVQVGDDELQLLADQKKISTGSVVDAAVFSVDEDAATVIASVEVTVKDDANPDEEASLKRNRFSADLVKVDDKWLLESLDQVAVSLG